MTKSAFKESPSTEAMNEVLFGSSNYIQTKVLDRRAVNTAISRCIMPYDWKIEEYSNTEAAQDVVDELLKAGFRKVYSKWSIIYQDNVKFKVGRPLKNLDMFVAFEEKAKKEERGHTECHYWIK